MIDEYLERFHGIDWEDMRQVADRTQAPLASLANDKKTLAAMLKQLETNAEMLSLSEHLTWCDKLVLHDDPSPSVGFRLRLHFFLPGYSDRPHSHRWSFSTYILRGGYQHNIFGSDENFEGAEATAVRPLLIRFEQPGTSYSLHHSVMHSFSAEPYTVSLIVRGPAVKDRSVQFDGERNRISWKYGLKDESQSGQPNATLDHQRLEWVARELRGFGLIA